MSACTPVYSFSVVRMADTGGADTRFLQPWLQLAHEGHQGIVKTKQLLRQKVWFPNIDAQVELLQSAYHAKQVAQRLNQNHFGCLSYPQARGRRSVQISLDLCQQGCIYSSGD